MKEGSYNLVAARKSFPKVLLEGLLESTSSAALSREVFSHSRPGKQTDWMAGSGYLWLHSPGHSKTTPPTHTPSTWPVTSDLGPVANTGVGEVGVA